MWNDEDNNPYGDDFDRRDSFTSSNTNSTSPNECMCHFTSPITDRLSHLVAMFYNVPLGLPSDTDTDWDWLDPQYDIPQSSEQAHHPSYASPANAIDSDEDDEVQAQLVPRRKPGGYDSRIEQILYENPQLPILITDAGKSLESGGRHIVYTIRTGVRVKLASWFFEI